MIIFQGKSKQNLSKRAHTLRKLIETSTNGKNPQLNELKISITIYILQREAHSFLVNS